MNLAIHGLEGDIREGNSYYDDLHNATGGSTSCWPIRRSTSTRVDKERLEGDVGKGRRFPFGLPAADNANYLWIQLFYSALSEKGRAGFVMANSASDARVIRAGDSPPADRGPAPWMWWSPSARTCSTRSPCR